MSNNNKLWNDLIGGELTDTSKKAIIIAGIIFGVAVVAFLLWWFLIYKKKHPAAPPPGILPMPPIGPTPPISPTPPIPPTPPIGPTPPISPTAPVGLWVRDPYSAGSTTQRSMGIPPNRLLYSEAGDYCGGFGAKLATKDQLVAAYNKGFEYCVDGWLDDNISGHVSLDSDCGNMGYNSGPAASDYNPREPVVTYCYGPIPSTDEVAKSVRLQ